MEKGVPPNQISQVTGKTVKVLLDRYIGESSEDETIKAMHKAYGFDMTVS